MLEFLEELVEFEERIDWERVDVYTTYGEIYVILDTAREASILVGYLEEQETRNLIVKTRDRKTNYAVFD